MAWRDDSDAASFLSTDTDPLSSPSDGYFRTRAQSHPEDMYIDTEAANADSKLPVTPSSSSPRSASRYLRSQETTPLLASFLGQDAPPTYLEATTPSRWNARPSEDEARRLLSFDGRISPEPQSLADPPDRMYQDFDNRRRSLREHCSRKRMLKFIAAILFIIILAAIVTASTQDNKKKTGYRVPAGPHISSAPGLPQKDYPIRWPKGCSKDYKVQSETFAFGSPSEFSVREAIQQLSTPYERVSGWIHVVPAPADQPSGTIQAKFSYAISSDVDVSSVKYYSTASGLTIGSPKDLGLLERADHGMTCLGMSVVVYISSGTQLENLDVHSVHLGMQVHHGVSFTVKNSTTISLTSGTLDATPFDSRSTHLKTIAGSISGKYPLYNLLDIETMSGSVNINVEPKEKGENADETAIFRASSISGSIRADFERKKIPNRKYHVSIDTTVGTVEGAFIHGLSTWIASVAGYVNVDLLPFQWGDAASTIETSSSNAKTTLVLRSPYGDVGDVLTKLTSRHKSVSGGLDITYPQEWAGHLKGSSLNGALHLQGRDLELIDQTEQPGRNYVEAKKGKGESELAFETVSGGCEVKVGRL